MDNIAVEDINNVMDDPEGGCIVQADDPHMLAVAAFGGLNTGSAITGNNSWYWTSMLKLMEQGPAVPSTSSTHNNNNTGADHFTPGQQAVGPMPTSMSVSTSSPSSSSVHDQPINDMLANSHALNANDPDNSVWGQEFLSGPIGETKTSTSMHHLACSDDGLDELLYPRTVLELLFSDQLKLEQLPSWPDILQQTASCGTPPGRNFGYPLVPDKIMTSTAHHNVMSDNQHFDIKIPSHNYCHLGGLADDRLSSSTATSALSENTINQWAPPNVAGTECEHAHARPGATIHGMQQIDHTLVKQEYTEAPSPAYSNTDNIDYINNINDPKIFSQYMHHQQQIHLRLLADKTAGNVIHDEAMINHEITAANFSHNLRQGGLDANNYCQHVNNHAGTGVTVFDHSRVGPAPAASLHFINQPSHQLGKKSRSLVDQGVGVGAKGGAQVDKLAAPKKETEIDTKPSSHQLQRLHMNSSSTNTGGTNYTTSSPHLLHHQQQQQQLLSGTEYSFKRSRIEQTPPPSTSSSSSFKSQPARKEKLGERIPTLQQLVSPFGKTDTASVLLEAIGYIKFLQDQVQALSSPYFKSPTTQSGDRSHNVDEAKPDLRSRGLCLVPLSCTMQIANDNGADYWYGGGFR